MIHSPHTFDGVSSGPRNINSGTTSSYSKGVPNASFMSPYGSIADKQKQTEVLNLNFFDLREDIVRLGIFQSAQYFALKLRLYCFQYC